jgi:hypothetical protein
LAAADHLSSAAVQENARSGIDRDVYLLWVRGLRGPYPQVVFCDQGDEPTLGHSTRSSLVFMQKLHPELHGKSLAELATVFPLLPK